MVLLNKRKEENKKKIYILLKREVNTKNFDAYPEMHKAEMKGEIIWQYRLVSRRQR